MRSTIFTRGHGGARSTSWPAMVTTVEPVASSAAAATMPSVSSIISV